MKEANSNIEELIDIIIFMKEEKEKTYCCDPVSYADGLCLHNCEECKETYYQIMKNSMMEKYAINE